MEEPNRHCRNCDYPLGPLGEYCPNCAQRYTDGKINLRDLLRDFLESFLNFDSRVFRTMAALFLPGKLSIEYFRGRHQRYLSPLRLFFSLAVFHFAILGFLGNSYIEEWTREFSESSRKKAYQSDLHAQLDSARIKVERAYPGDATVQALDSLEKLLVVEEVDTIILVILQRDERGQYGGQDIALTWWDIIELSPEQLFEKHHITGFWERLQVGQFVKFFRQGGNFASFFLGKLIWMVVLMMPALALILKLLYIRRRRYFVEHLVFSFHYHSFAFLMISAALLLAKAGAALSPDSSWENLVFAAFFAVLIYMYAAMKRFYGQGGVKTFIKYALVNYAYLFIFVLFLVLTLLVSALVF